MAPTTVATYIPTQRSRVARSAHRPATTTHIDRAVAGWPASRPNARPRGVRDERPPQRPALSTPPVGAAAARTTPTPQRSARATRKAERGRRPPPRGGG